MKTPADYNKYINLSSETLETLEYWANLPDEVRMPISMRATETVTTDAAPCGLGIHFRGDLISEDISEEFLDYDISIKELYALKRFLRTLGSDLTDTRLIWRVDNNSALFAIKNEGSKTSWNMNTLAVSILEEAAERGISFQPIRVSSEENIVADSASRAKAVPDWSLDDKVAANIFRVWGWPDVDLMASDLSRKLPLFYSWSRRDVEAFGLDSLAEDVSWGQFNLPYVFPPFPLIGQVLDKARKEKVDRMIIVVPWWPTKPFFPMLVEMALDSRKLPRWDHLVVDFATGKPPPQMSRLKLAAVLITGTCDQKIEDSRRRRAASSKTAGDNRQSDATEQHGLAGCDTVRTAPDWYRLRRL